MGSRKPLESLSPLLDSTFKNQTLQQNHDERLDREHESKPKPERESIALGEGRHGKAPAFVGGRALTMPVSS